MRLLVWGREWGVVEGKLEAHLQAEGRLGNERLRPLATQILTQLYQTITDFKKLQDKYGLMEESASPTTQKKEAQTKQETGTASRIRNEIQLKAKWVISDREKFMVFLGDLKDYNDGLERLFPHDRLATLHRVWTNELLQNAQQDLEKLSLLEKASSGVYEQLNASASLKQLRINLDATPAASFRPTFALKIQRHLLSISDLAPRRSHGIYQNPATSNLDDVIVEWIEYDKQDVDERFLHMRRIDDLARMVHMASDRHPDLHTIDCIGYTEDSATSRYGLVYKAPFSSSSTLHSIIASNDHRTPDLGDRFKLAHTLAVALWSFHSLDWLHKSLSSNNILFFPSALATTATKATSAGALVPDISLPYLLGFDLSRPEHLVEMSVQSRNTSAMDLHRHPDTLNGMERKPYCKSYDIYSLGLILLEIGLWKALQAYHKPHYTAAKFRDRVVLSMLVPGLGSKTGSVYRTVVEKCLFAKGDLSGAEAGDLMECVVGTLESLRV
jgi:hypothetical protein